MVFIFDTNGTADVLLDGEEIDPSQIGRLHDARRAAHVEPRVNREGKIEWTVDLTPLYVGRESPPTGKGSESCILGPFGDREAALCAERHAVIAWLEGE